MAKLGWVNRSNYVYVMMANGKIASVPRDKDRILIRTNGWGERFCFVRTGEHCYKQIGRII